MVAEVILTPIVFAQAIHRLDGKEAGLSATLRLWKRQIFPAIWAVAGNC